MDSVTKYQGQNTNGSEYRRTKYRGQNTAVKIPQYRIPQVIIPVSKYQWLQYHTGQNTVLVKIPYWTKYRTGQNTALDKIPHMIYIYALQSHQSAYRPGHSVETAIQHVYSRYVNSLTVVGQCFLIFLELSAAFDTNSHQHLIDLLASKFKIGGTVLSWIRSYPTDQSYRVKICSDLSEPICSNVGVPQGSVLGPILFNCVMASLPKLLNSIGIKSHMYAAKPSSGSVLVTMMSSTMRLQLEGVLFKHSLSSPTS